MYNHFYKIKDTEDDRYSDYLATDKECKKLIEKGINYHEEYPNDECLTNAFDCIEYFLDMYDISFKWINFEIVEY